VGGGGVISEYGGAGVAPFVVSVTGTYVSDVKVDFDTMSGTALENADFAGGSGTLTFRPCGERSQVVPVPILDDPWDEPDETFTLDLSAPVNASIGTASATATIVDDDEDLGTPVASITDTAAYETSRNEWRSLRFNISLSHPSQLPVVVDFQVMPGTATTNVDYKPRAKSVVFAPGAVARPVYVRVFGDTVVEGDETVTMILTGATNALLGRAAATGTILEDEALPVPWIRLGNTTIAEGDLWNRPVALNLTATRPLGWVGALPVTVSAAGGTATSDDFFAYSGNVLAFHPESFVPVSVLIKPDTIPEPDETIVVTITALGAPGWDGAGTTGTITIVDDD
jgi:hypothetical protein